MERKVGETIIYNGKTYQAVAGGMCKNCAFSIECSENIQTKIIFDNFGYCNGMYRLEGDNIVFKEIKDVEVKSNQLTINIPKGMEIDLKNSDLTKGVVKFKKKNITYDDIWSALISKDIFSEMNFNIRNNKKLDAISKLISIARYYNEDWRPDWSNSKENKYCIKFNYHKDRFYVDYNNSIGAGDVFFKNSEDARAVINNPNFKDILNIIYKNQLWIQDK